VPLRLGETFDRYVVEEILGEGGMGEVYLATDARLHRRVALKLLRGAAGARSEPGWKGAARLLHEARAAAALDHPNAVSIFDVGEHEGTPFIAMEFVSGSTLRAFVGDATVSVAHRVRWLTDIARALDAAHRRGLVHRDIKPENVMVSENDAIKVLDFGIARRASASTEETGATLVAGGATITRDGAVVGTPRYMAPEQLRGAKLDGRADQFSWGVVAYELLTGHLPWSGDGSSDQRLARILTVEARAPSLVTRDVPPEVDAVVLRALARDPKDRFASMENIVLALDPSPASKGRIPRRLAGGAATSAKAMPTTPGAATVTHRPTVNQEAPRARARSPRRRMAIAFAAVVAAIAVGVVAARKRTTAEPLLAPAPFVSASAARRVTLLDPPTPTTSNDPRALGAYREALQAAHRGDLETPNVKLEEAVRADPGLLEARLRVPIYAMLARQQTSVANNDAADLARLTALESRLAPRDRALLDAFRPAMGAAVDFDEWERKLIALGDENREDEELVGISAHFLFGLFGRADAAEKQCQWALELDPTSEFVSATRIEALSYLGRIAESRAVIAACLVYAPGTYECLRQRYYLERQSGECAGILATSKDLVRSAETGFSYQALANGLAVTGQPPAAIDDAVAHLTTRSPPLARVLTDRRYIFEGNLPAALALARIVDSEAAKTADALSRGQARSTLVELLIEIGRPDEALALAKDFVERRAALQPPLYLDDSATMSDPVPRFLGMLHESGRMSDVAFERAQAQWIAEHVSVRGAYRYAVWVAGPASAAQSRDRAKAAIDAEAEYGPPFAFWSYVAPMAYVGRVHLLAGDARGALPSLEQLVLACDVLADPTLRTRALLWLGDARAATGDGAGACEAYARILGRWGRAPKSVTADAARVRMRAAKCAAEEHADPSSPPWPRAH
jgi:hypothetical protein